MGKSSPAFHFQIEGDVVGFTGNGEGKLKYLQVAIADRTLEIKLPKKLRQPLSWELKQGDRVRVLGTQKLKGSLGTLNLKADRVHRLSCALERCPEGELSWETPTPCAQKGKILLCQKSGCLKRGGKQLLVTLKEALSQLGLEEYVKIERTGCQKRCKKAPNAILMPGKVRCTKQPPNTITELLEQHYFSQN